MRDRQCALNHDAIESASIVSSVINKPTTLSWVYHLSTDDLLWRNFLSPQCRNCSRESSTLITRLPSHPMGLCVCVCLYVNADELCRNGWTVRDAVWGQTRVAQRTLYLMGVQIRDGELQFHGEGGFAWRPVRNPVEFKSGYNYKGLCSVATRLLAMIHGVKWRHRIYDHDRNAILWVWYGIMRGVKGRRFIVLFK